MRLVALHRLVPYRAAGEAALGLGCYIKSSFAAVFGGVWGIGGRKLKYQNGLRTCTPGFAVAG